MSVMFEVYYRSPENPAREAALAECVSAHGGRLDFREGPLGGPSDGVCLTFEFSDLAQARAAAEALRRRGEHVEGPADYGD